MLDSLTYLIDNETHAKNFMTDQSDQLHKMDMHTCYGLDESKCADLKTKFCEANNWTASGKRAQIQEKHKHYSEKYCNM